MAVDETKTTMIVREDRYPSCSREDAMRAAELICDELARRAVCRIKPHTMFNFLVERWGIVSPLAHMIHEVGKREANAEAADIETEE